MADQFVQVAPDSTGKKIDSSEVVVGAQVVQRQRIVLADDATAGGVAKVQNTAPAGTEQALVTRNIPSGTQAVSDGGGSLTVDGTVAITGTVPVSLSGALPVTDNGGSLTVDGSVSLAAPIPAGTNNIGDVDIASMPAITGTVAVSTLPALVAGTANIGDVDIASVAAGASIETEGHAAHDAPVTGNPLLNGAYASATAPAAVSAAGDVVRLWADLNGRLQVGDGGSTLSVDDGAGSLTVDGSVAVTSLPALPAGTNNIGDVDIVTMPAITGTVGVSSLPALPAGTNNIGDVDIVSMPAVTGTVAVSSLPSLPAGTNNIGDVDIVTMPAITGTVAISTLPALPAGNNNIGNVDVLTLPSLPAGTNNIGDVDIASIAAGVLVEVQGDAAHNAPATGNPVLVGAYGSSTPPTTVTDGDAVRLWADQSGRLQIGDGGSSLSIDDGGNSITVDYMPISNGLNTNLAALNASMLLYHADLYTLIITGTWVATVVFEVTNDGVNYTAIKAYNLATGVLAATATTNGAYLVKTAGFLEGRVRLSAYTSGTVVVGDAGSYTGSGGYPTIIDPLPAGTNNIGDVDIAGVTVTSGALDVNGGTAHDAADAGNPVKIGGKASTAAPTAVAVGDRVNAWFDTNGKLAIFDGGTSLTVDGSVSLAAAIPAGTNNIGDVDIAGVNVTANALDVNGGTAHDAVDAGNPLKIGGKASTAVPTAVAVGDRVNAWFDTFGRLQIGYNTAGLTDDTATTNIVTANAALTLNTEGSGAASILITGTWVGTVAFEASIDGTSWVFIEAYNMATQTRVTTTTVNGSFLITPAGFRQVRARCSAYTSGTIVTYGRASVSSAVRNITIVEPLPTGTNSIGNVRQQAATAAITSVADSAVSVTLLAANTNRASATFFNDSTSTLYIAYAATASTATFTVKVPAGGFYEMPQPVYTGAISGIWSADSTGTVKITQVTY